MTIAPPQLDTISTLNTVAFFSSQADFSLLQPLQSGQLVQQELQKGGLQTALDHSIKHSHYDIWLVDISREDFNESLLQQIKQLKGQLKKDCRLLLLSKVTQLAEYRRLQSAGADQVFTLPLDQDELIAQMKSYALGTKQRTSNSKGMAIWGARGGVGTTTLAANLVQYFGNELNRHLLYIDLDCFRGDSALTLGSDSNGQLAASLQASDRLDWLLLDRSVMKVTERIHLLNDLLPLEESFTPQADALVKLSQLVASRYNTHIWEIPHFLPVTTCSALLAQLQVCVLVSDATLAGVRELQRNLRFVQQFEHLRPLVVLNNSRGHSGRLLSVEKIETLIQMPISVSLPFAAKEAVESAEQGGLMLNKSKKFHHAIAKLGDECLGLKTLQRPWYQRLKVNSK